MHVLVTGGAGYIGSHTCVTLLEAGHRITVLDNLCNSSEVALERVREITGCPIRFIKGDVRNAEDLSLAFTDDINAVIHFAGLKAVGESISRPLAYFDNNVSGTISLLHEMDRNGVNQFIFSSSATVYGDPDRVPVDENSALQVTNPYGQSKLVAECLIRTYSELRPDVGTALLRYFNPVGAHPSGKIGEQSIGTPNNLMPYVAQVAAGIRPRLRVWGADYPTSDGTGVRDYIHVMDLAEAHVRALEFVSHHKGVEPLNIGTGRGHSVLELIKAFEAASGRPVPYEIQDRRPGDVGAVWANPSRAQDILEWRATRGLFEMCQDTWRWQLTNPLGYSS